MLVRNAQSLAIVAALLGGCASAPLRVDVPVMLPCLGPAPEAPAYRFGIGGYPSTDAEAVAILWGDLSEAKRYALDLAAQSSRCQ